MAGLQKRRKLKHMHKAKPVHTRSTQKQEQAFALSLLPPVKGKGKDKCKACANDFATVPFAFEFALKLSTRYFLELVFALPFASLV